MTSGDKSGVDTGPRLTWGRLVIGVVILAVAGWLVWTNLPRPVRAELGLVPAVDKFDYASWDSQVLLERDHNGVPVVTVTETVVARFPDHDQNKGIVRGLPSPRRTSITNIAVTDSTGDRVRVSTEYDRTSGMLYLLLGTDDYVHGDQTYVITYQTGLGVVADPRHDVQELYWNLLPLDSAQAIDTVSATVRVDPDLTFALTGQHACYQGRFGSTDPCDLQVSTTEDGSTVYTYSSGRRAPGDGVTVAVGFAATTFNQVTTVSDMTPPSALEGMYNNGTLAAIVATLSMALGWVADRMHRWFAARRAASDPRPSRLPPLPQGGVPATLPPPVALALLRADQVQRGIRPAAKSEAMAGRAEIIHLAVQGAIRFEGTPGRSRMAVRLVDRDLARHRVDQKMLAILFPGRPAPGTVRTLPRKDSAFANAVQSMDKAGRRAAKAQGLLRLRSHPLAIVLVVVAIVLAVVSMALVLLAPGEGRLLPVLIALFALVVAFLFGSAVLAPEPLLTERGWSARDQLRSVRSHLRRELRHHDEAGVRGAEVVDDDGVQVLQVYERLLPYAMLFGLEDKWTQMLTIRYGSDRSPVWLSDSDSAFLGHWQYVNNSVRRSGTYVAPSSSSDGGGSSGGSSGGGFSGGGGGGGFSGGR